MIKEIPREDMIDESGKLDVYTFIRAQEIREYMRKSRVFDLEDKLHIILKSMNPYEGKLIALKCLAQEPELSAQEKEHVLEVIHYVERLLQELTTPELPAVFVVNECYTVEGKKQNSYEASKAECVDLDYFRSYQEFLKCYSDCVPDEGKSLPQYRIDLVYQVLPSNKNQPITLWATWFEDGIHIFSIRVDHTWGTEHYFKDKVMQYLYEDGLSYSSLPYPSMSRVQLLTPFMRQALVGILESNLDGNGCWYHFFYPDGEERTMDNCMNLSWQMMDVGDPLMVFDWLSSVEGKAAEEEINEVQTYSLKTVLIADIEKSTECTEAAVSAQVIRVVKEELADPSGERKAIHMEIEDESGRIMIPIEVAAGDMGWIEAAVEKHAYIRANLILKQEENGICIQGITSLSVIERSMQ